MPNLMPGENSTTWTPGNIDLATQQAELARKRQILQAMQLMSLQQQPTEMAGQVAIRNSPVNLLGRVLQGWAGGEGMDKLGQQERGLVQRQQQQSADAVTDLMQSAQPTPGTPTTMTEVQGPMPDGGQAAPRVEPGTAPGFNMPGFAKAYAKAQSAGVPPSLMADMLQQFNRNRMLTQLPSGAELVPGWNAGGPPSLTQLPGGEQQLRMPAVGAGGSGVAAGGAGGGAPGGSLMGVPSIAAALLMSGDPALGKLGTEVAERTRPVNAREGGSLIQYDAQGQPHVVLTTPKLPEGTQMAGGTVSALPGYIPTKAAITGSQKAAELPYQRPVDMPLPGGGTMPVPAEQVMARGAQAQGVPATAAQLNSPATGPFPSAEAALAARGQPQQYGPQSTMAKEESSTVGKNLGDQQLAVDNAANAAQAALARNQEMRAMVAQFKPGAGVPAREALAKIADAFGMDDATVNKIMGGNLSAVQAMGKSVVDNAFTETRAALGGTNQRIGQQEVLLKAQKGSVNGTLTMPAIMAMLDYSNGIANWQVDKQNFKDQWVQQKGSYAGFEGWFNRNHPLTGKNADGAPYIPTKEQLDAALAAPRNSPQQPAMRGEIPQPQPPPTKVLNGVTYVQQNGQWFQQ